jgi:signal transduction histidine kinase
LPSLTSYSSSYKISEGKLILLWITSSIALAIGIFILDKTFVVWTSIDFGYRIIAVFFIILLVIIVVTILYDIYSRSKQMEQEFSKNLLKTQEVDKKKIATELHDGLQQNLHSINFDLHRYAKEHPTTKWKVDEVTERINSIISEIRTISSELYPHQLENLGLRKSIRALANNITDSTDIYVQANIPDDLDLLLDYDASINIYRIVQELCNNIVKHSKAENAIIEVKYDKVLIYINVTDDGKGFEEQHWKLNSFKKGLGLSSIQRRVRTLNGILVAASEKNKGASFKITIPLKNINMKSYNE